MEPQQVADFAARDTNRLSGRIAESLALKSPWIDVLEGGTVESVSDTVRTVVQERAVMSASLAQPVFQPDVEMCGTVGGVDQVGSTEYTYRLASIRGRGPKICVKQTRTAFKETYVRAQQSLERGTRQLINADIRATLMLRSGVKFVCKTATPFDSLVSGDQQEIDVQFVQQLPDAPLNFKALWRIGAFAREELLTEPWESEGGVFLKFIGSLEAVEGFRQELDIKEDMRSFVQGKYQIGETAINSFAFSGPYRNFAFAVDQQPLRSTGFDENGDLVLLEPEVAEAVTNGVAARRNPAWVAAPYEVGFVIGANSFSRLVPEQYTGEGDWKFSPQLSGGDLEWAYFRDNDCNLFGDYGHFIYQISRAYKPLRPHAVIPVLFKRCRYDLGLEACTESGGNSL